MKTPTMKTAILAAAVILPAAAASVPSTAIAMGATSDLFAATSAETRIDEMVVDPSIRPTSDVSCYDMTSPNGVLSAGDDASGEACATVNPDSAETLAESSVDKQGVIIDGERVIVF